MSQTIQAVYEHGVFTPRTPVDLPEHTVVKLVLPKPHILKKTPAQSLESIFDIAPGGSGENDLAKNHDHYLYGFDPK